MEIEIEGEIDKERERQIPLEMKSRILLICFFFKYLDDRPLLFEEGQEDDSRRE